MRIPSLFILIFILNISNTNGGVWTKKKNEGYSQLSYTYIKSSSLFNKDGSTINLRRSVDDYTLQGYLEYGLSDKFTVITIFPFKMVSAEPKILDSDQFTDTLPSGSLNGFGNISFGGRYRLFNKKIVTSVQFKVDGNNFSANQLSGLSTGYNTWMFNPAILIGKSYKKFYETAEIGVILRMNGYSHLFHSIYELGYSRKGKTWFVLVLDVLLSFYNGNYHDNSLLQTGLYVNDQESISYGLKVFHRFGNNWGMNFSGFGSFYGNQVAHFPALTFGISYEWGK